MVSVTVSNRLEINGHLPGQVGDTIRGRLIFPNPAGKDKARVFDYCDINVGVLENAARGRARVYAS